MSCNVWRPDESQRFLDEKGRPITVVDITVRANHGRMALTPTKRNNELIVGALGRAQEKYDFEVYVIAFLNNHGHYTIGIRSAEHEAFIKEFFHGNTAREINRHGHHGKKYRSVRTKGRMFDRPNKGIVVLDEQALEERFRYALSNGTKEGLVAHPTHMPSVHAAKPLCRGDRELHGVWYNRTELDKLRRQSRKPVSEDETATRYTVKLSKLPFLRHLSDEEYAQYCRNMCDDIAVESRAKLVAEHGPNFRVVGARKMRQMNPLTFPEEMATNPAPLVFCTDKEEREAYVAAYREFVEAYQLAHRHLREAIRTGRRTRIEFPHGGIPPAGLLTG